MGRRQQAKLRGMRGRSPYKPFPQFADRTKVSKTRLARLAKEGYQKMAREDLLDAEAYLSTTTGWQSDPGLTEG